MKAEHFHRSVLRRAWIVRRLGKPGNSVAVESLSRILETDPDADVRGLAAIALARIGDPLAAPALMKGLDDPTIFGQMSAILAVWRLRDSGSVARLCERVVGSSSADVRFWAAEALGDIGGAAAVPPLINALGDSKRSVRAAVVRSLAALGDRRAIAPLQLARQSAGFLARRRIGRALEKLEGRGRPSWRVRVMSRVLSTDRLIRIEMGLFGSFQLASSVSKAIKIWGKGGRQLAAAIAWGEWLLGLPGREHDGLDFLERAVRQYPDDPEIRMLYATFLLPSRPEDVAAQASKAVELAPADPATLVRAGHLLLNRGDEKTSLSCALRASELVDASFVLMGALDNLTGCLAISAGEYDLAEEKLRSAVNREPTKGSFVQDLAVCLAETGQLSEGVKVLEGALEHVEDQDQLERIKGMRDRMAGEADS